MLSDNKTRYRKFMLGNIHPTALIGLPPEHRDYKKGTNHHGVLLTETTRVGAYCTVDGGRESETLLGERVWLMKGVHVGHDSMIGNDTEVAPKACIGGHVTIGRNVKIGMSAVVKPRVRIGDGAVIGCGAVVVDDVPPHTVVVGNPARKLRMAYGTTDDVLKTNEEMWHEQFERGRTR